MNKLICKICGYEKLYMGTDYRNEDCGICGGKMYLKKENEREIVEELVNTDKEFYTLKEVIEMDLIRSMVNTLNTIGDKRTWLCIERMTNAKQRIVFRQGFFKAGGKV